MQDNRFRENLLARVSITQVIGKRVKLKKTGAGYTGLCPFHPDKNPSMSVTEDKGLYHCFSCGASGNAITFVMEMDRLSYGEAIQTLADSVGMEVPKYRPMAPEEQQKRDNSYELLQKANDYFVKSLGMDVGRQAQDYLKRRGLSNETISEFAIGFAVENSKVLQQDVYGQTDESDLELLDNLSIIRKSANDNSRYAFFRNRIMFPIQDRKGQIIAFGGRYMGTDSKVGKYINSGDSELFHKGDNLYNIHRATKSVRDNGELIVAEGYMDVIALTQAGFSAVAPLGTAITESQLRMLWRLHASPIMAFDGDNAGRKAAHRAAMRSLPLLTPQQTLRFVFLPNGEDPDSFIQANGRGAFADFLQQAQNIEDFLWDIELATLPLNSFSKEADLSDRLLKGICNQIEDFSLQNAYKRGFKDRLFHHFRNTGKKVAKAEHIKKPYLKQITRLEGAGLLLKMAKSDDYSLDELFHLDFVMENNLNSFLIDLQTYYSHPVDEQQSLDSYMKTSESAGLWNEMEKSQRLSERVRQAKSPVNQPESSEEHLEKMKNKTQTDIVEQEYAQQRIALKQQIKDAIRDGADDSVIHELMQHLENLKIPNQPFSP